MIVVFTAQGTEWESKIDLRFGRAKYLLIYDTDTGQLSHIDNREIDKVAHGAGPQTAQKLFDLKPDVLLTGNGPGGGAARVLDQIEMKTFIGTGEVTIREAYEAYKNGELKEM